MQEQFITHEFSQILVELGFKEQVIALWHGELEYSQNLTTKYLNSDTKAAAILWQQAFNWFLKKYQLHSTITSISQESWQWHITKPGETLGKLYDEDFYTYEEARLACLQKLIEIVKNKK